MCGVYSKCGRPSHTHMYGCFLTMLYIISKECLLYKFEALLEYQVSIAIGLLCSGRAHEYVKGICHIAMLNLV
jgi:hypothetical protein